MEGRPSEESVFQRGGPVQDVAVLRVLSRCPITFESATRNFAARGLRSIPPDAEQRAARSDWQCVGGPVVQAGEEKW